MTNDTRIDFKEYENLLREQMEVYMDIRGFPQLKESLDQKIASKHHLLARMLYPVVGYIPNSIAQKVIYDYFDVHGVPDKYLTGNTIANPLLDKILNEGYCSEFITIFKQMNSLSHFRDKLRKIINRKNYARMEKGNENEDLIVIPYNIKAIENRRFSTRDDNIIGYYDEMKAGLSARKGYLILGGDFPQIDGKGAINTYLKSDLANDIIEQVDDTYLVFKELVRHTNHKIDELDLQDALNAKDYRDTRNLEKRISKYSPAIKGFNHPSERDVYKVIALSTVYNARSHPNPELKRQMLNLARVLEHSGRYALMEQYAKYLFKMGYPISVTSKFGTVSNIIRENEYAMLSKLFNTPIQTTSSEIIANFTMTLVKEMRRRGYSKDDFRIYVNRHDEPVFEIKEEVFMQEYMLFKEFSYLNIEGWRPFKIKWFCGYRYKDFNSKYARMISDAPYDETEFQSTKAHLTSVEPMPLNIPEIAGFAYRCLPDGRVIFGFVRYVGDLINGEIFNGIAKDNRPMEYALGVTTLNAATINMDYIIGLTAEALKGLNNTKNYLVAYDLPYDKRVTAYSQGGYSIYTHSYDNIPLRAAKSIVASVVNQLMPSIMTDADTVLLKNASKYKQMRKRVLSK